MTSIEIRLRKLEAAHTGQLTAEQIAEQRRQCQEHLASVFADAAERVRTRSRSPDDCRNEEGNSRRRAMEDGLDRVFGVGR